MERDSWHLVGHAFFNRLSQLRVVFSIVKSSSRLEIRLYGERFARRDVLLGAHEMIPVESQTGSSLCRTFARANS